jgi:hypothetical protein
METTRADQSGLSQSPPGNEKDLHPLFVKADDPLSL